VTTPRWSSWNGQDPHQMNLPPAATKHNADRAGVPALGTFGQVV
jgi:hypothetical protein